MAKKFPASSGGGGAAPIAYQMFTDDTSDNIIARSVDLINNQQLLDKVLAYFNGGQSYTDKTFSDFFANAANGRKLAISSGLEADYVRRSSPGEEAFKNNQPFLDQYVSTSKQIGKDYRLDGSDHGTSTPRKMRYNNDGTKIYVEQGSKIVQYALLTAYDVSTNTFETETDIPAEITIFSSFHFKSDGTKVYIMSKDGSDNVIYQYSLSPAWNFSSISYDSVSVDLEATAPGHNINNVIDMWFDPTGEYFYVIDNGTDKFYGYKLSTPWDITTIQTIVEIDQRYVGGNEPSPYGLAFSADGLMMYIVGESNDTVFQYRLGEPWDVYSNGDRFYVGSEEFSPRDVSFSSDGTNMYVIGSSSDSVHQYTLSTAWDVSTTSYASKSVDISSEETNASGVTFSSDGTNMYIVGFTNNTVYQYTLSTAWDVSTASYASKSVNVGGQEANPQELRFSSDGTNMYIVGLSNDTVYQYTLSTAWDVSTASYASKTFLVSSQSASPYGMSFSSDGTKMYVVDISNNNVYQYTLSTAWDVSTASYASKSVNVGGQDSNPVGVTFSSDGTKMYIVGNSGKIILQYTVPTAWDVSTIIAANSFPVNAQETSPLDVFSSDGTKLYIIGGSSGDHVNQYTLSTAWDISTASYDTKKYFVGSQENNPFGVTFSSDGTNMYIVGFTNDTVYQYTLSTAWDVSTASYASKSVNVGGQDIDPVGVTFSSDGTKMLVLGLSNDTVYKYTLSTAWDVSTASPPVININIPINSQMYNPEAMYIDSTGTQLIICGTGSGGGGVFRYVFNDAWTTNPLYVNDVLYVDSYLSPSGIVLNPDGTKIYISGSSPYIYSFATLTSYVNTAFVKYDHIRYKNAKSISVYETEATSLTFKPDGTVMYVAGASGDDINQFNLATAWDVSTATHNGQKYIFNGWVPRGMCFKPDGTSFYVMHASSSQIMQYTVSTPWDITTLNATPVATINVYNGAGTGMGGSIVNHVFFKPDGTKFFVTSASNHSLHAYTMSTPWDLSTALYDNVSFNYSNHLGNSNYNLFFNTTGTRWYTHHSSYFYIFKMTTPWDITTSELGAKLQIYINTSFSLISGTACLYVSDDETHIYAEQSDYIFDNIVFGDPVTNLPILEKTLNLNSDDSNMKYMHISSDGKYLMTRGFATNLLYSYLLTTPWDISTAAKTGTSSSIISPSYAGLSMSFDGRKAFWVYNHGTVGGLYSGTLTTPWDASTLVDSGTYVLNTIAVDNAPGAFYIDPSGRYFYFFGILNRKIYQYTLSTPWDFSTAAYNSYYDPGTPSSNGMHFDLNGKTFYFIDSSYVIHKYNLTTPWDISTTTKSGQTLEFPVNILDIIWSPDSRKFYTVYLGNFTQYNSGKAE